MVETDGYCFKCPFCSFMSWVKGDLFLHLSVFGWDADFHSFSVNDVHNVGEFELGYVHGEADKVIREFENVILGYRSSEWSEATRAIMLNE